MRVEVRIGDQVLEVQSGTRVDAVLGAALVAQNEIVAATMNNHLVGLEARLEGSATIRPISRHESEGADVVRRASSLVFHAALARHFPDLRVAVGQSIGGSYFYEIEGGDARDLEALAQALSERIDELASAALELVHRRLPVEAVPEEIQGFSETKMRLLRTWVAPFVPTVALGEFVEIAHGPYPPTTAAAKGTRVRAYPPGLLLEFPGAKGVVSAPGAGRRAIWDAYRETRDWNRTVGVEAVGDLNQAILEGRIGDVVRVSEALHEKRIAKIADAIAHRESPVRVVCLAGPSSSGKTTVVRRLSVQLRVNGIEPVAIGLDDYYRDRDDMARDEHGQIDFEALEALDVPLIQEQLQALVEGRSVWVPRFDFTRQRRVDRGKFREVSLKAHQVLLVEGIHGLNPALTAAIPAEAKFQLFISAMGQLVIDEQNRIHTTDGRLLRRLVRDRRYRGTSAAETISRWASVRRGEQRHIFPHQDQADMVFNSGLVYEAAVLRTFAWRYLLEVPRDHPSRTKAYRLLRLLELFIPIFPDDVPANSVLREFIGGSGFSY